MANGGCSLRCSQLGHGRLLPTKNGRVNTFTFRDPLLKTFFDSTAHPLSTTDPQAYI